ncbi:MAG TPA: DNA repair exonuclease [Gemmatimonadaceae bacterium]|nr:DNA repair exonuclease [Gemmatimonadaceae bacterium]
MRLVHLADLHLGFRQYQRFTPMGINQREHDVALAFRKAIDKTIELQPDVVLFAGDVFHNVRPTNPAIIHAFKQLSRLVQMLPDAIVVMIAGNHDTPRTTETGCLLKLFKPLGIHVVDGTPELLEFKERDLSVLAVPNLDVAEVPPLRPQGKSRYNVLMLHGITEGLYPPHLGADREANAVTREQLGAQNWDYVALGHYHVWREVAPNAFYSGSLEYTTTNIWGEIAEESELDGKTWRAAAPRKRIGKPGKGFIEWDLATGKQTFHPIETRSVIDLPEIDARGMTSSEVDQAIMERVEASRDPVDDAVVRLVARNVARHVARELDHKALRELKRRALHFHLDLRRPDIIRVHGHASPGRRASLAELVRDGLRSRPIDSEIDREELVAAGLDYLAQAETVEQPVFADGPV